MVIVLSKNTQLTNYNTIQPSYAMPTFMMAKIEI